MSPSYIIQSSTADGELSSRPFGNDIVAAARYFDIKVRDFVRQSETDDNPITSVKFIHVLAEVTEGDILAFQYQ